MARIGFHASHEQFPPSELVRHLCHVVGPFPALGLARPIRLRMGLARSRPAGDALALRRHLGAGLPISPGDPREGGRDPARDVPPRLWMCLGSGQPLNEDLTGVAWPEKPDRNALAN